MGEGAIQSGGRAACSGGWGQCNDSYYWLLSTQSIAFKYVIASEPYRNTWYLKQAMADLPYINPASTENFFFEFWSDFLVCFPIRP